MASFWLPISLNLVAVGLNLSLNNGRSGTLESQLRCSSSWANGSKMTISVSMPLTGVFWNGWRSAASAPCATNRYVVSSLNLHEHPDAHRLSWRSEPRTGVQQHLETSSVITLLTCGFSQPKCLFTVYLRFFSQFDSAEPKNFQYLVHRIQCSKSRQKPTGALRLKAGNAEKTKTNKTRSED